MCKFPIYLHFIISLVSHFGQVPYLFTFHYICSVFMCKFTIFLRFIIYLVSIMCKYPIVVTFHYIFMSHYVSLFLSISLYLQCPILGKFPIYLHFIISLVSHYGQVPYLFTFHQIFSVPLCASSHIIFTFHYIFSVPLWASSLSIYISLYLQCPIWASTLSFYVSLYLQCPILCASSLSFDTFHYIFSVPFCASTLYSRFIISLVSHYGQVPYLFTFSLDLQCPIMCKFSIFLHFIISLVSHFGQVPYLFTFHYIFSVPLCASSLLLLHFIIFLMVSLLASTLSLRLIISFACHYVQVPYLFTFHYIFSVPFWASSLSIYVSLFLQCPIMCKFTIFLRFIISLVSHSGQVPYLVYVSLDLQFPLCALYFCISLYIQCPIMSSTLSFYVSLYLQCPIMCKFPTFVTFHYIFNGLITSKYPIITFNYIFRMSLCASSLSIYISLQCLQFPPIISVSHSASTPQLYVSLFLQCPIMCMFPIFLHFIIYLVSHYVRVPYHFMFHYMFSVPLCASTLLLLHFIIFLMVSLLASTLSLRLIISFASHYVQVPYLFTFHQIFSVPLCACSISFYLSLYLQCPIMCKFPTFVTFHYIFNGLNTSKYPIITFNYIFRMSLCASSLSIYISLYLQCPILGKFPIYLHFIRSSVSHYVQVLHFFPFHYIFSVPFRASSLSIYIPLDLQCPIMCKFPIFLPFIISFVYHYVQVLLLFTFHYMFSVPLCASSPYFYISFYIQCPILYKFPNFLCFVISSVSHSGQVPYNLVLHYIFSVPLCASSLSFYLSLFPLCTIMCKFPIFLPFIISSVSHYVQVLHFFPHFLCHHIFSVPFWASSLSIYIPLDLQCPILGKFPIYLHFIISLVSHLGKFPIYLHSIRSSVSHYVQVPYHFIPFIISLVSHYVQVP